MIMISRFACLLIAFPIFFISCKGGYDKQKKAVTSIDQSISINIGSEPQTLDPRKARNLNDINLVKMLMDGLTRIDKSNEGISLALAEKIEVSTDLKTYTVHLKEANWSNGDPVTSEDFLYAWKQSLSPHFNAPYANFLYVIKNAQEIKQGKLPLSLLGVDILDSKTLVINLNAPTPYFKKLLAKPIFFPVHAQKDRTCPSWASNPADFIGNGPFSLSEWKHCNTLELKKNSKYWDEKAVSLDTINIVMVDEATELAMFEKQALHWAGSPLSTIPTDAIESLRNSNSLQTLEGLGTNWIRVNTQNAHFKSQKLRRAFGLAINREEIVSFVTGGGQVATTSIVPPSLGLTKEPYFMDGSTEVAKQLFDEALQEMEITSNNLSEITLTYPSSDRAQRIAQTLQDQWLKAFNLQITLEALEPKVYFDRISMQDYTLALGDWIADFEDPINFLEVFKERDVGTNNTHWENPSYTELLKTANYCSSPESRLEMLSQSEWILIQDMPVIPLFHSSFLYTQDENLHGVKITSSGDLDFKEAYLRHNKK